MNEQETAAPDIEGEISALEQGEAEARIRPDIDRLDALWADNLIINATENLLFTKDLFLTRFRSGNLRYKSFQRRTMRVSRVGDTVIATGSESLVPSSGPDADHFVVCSYMNVWMANGRGWRLAARHVAIIARAPRDIESGSTDSFG